MIDPTEPLHLFAGYGLELELMIVDRETMAVRPLADTLLARLAGGDVTDEVELDGVRVSNELVNHVIEVKTNGPVPRLGGAAATLLAAARHLDGLLSDEGARLCGTGMHPFMDPDRETVLWAHQNDRIYATFDRIFDCRGHGWSNLQSVHLNLPFASDEELGALHAAVRLVLPLLPALAASTPFMDGRASGFLDTRLEVYRTNAARIPSITGRVVPEPVYTRAAYEREILDRIYRDVAPHDPEGVLREEWLNARGAIVRFDRSAIEIRVLDAQETPRADLAIVAAADAVLRALVDGRLSDPARQRQASTERLARIFLAAVRDGERARLDDAEYLALLGLDAASLTLREVWSRLLARCPLATSVRDEATPVLDTLLERGPLARRLLDRLGPEPTRDALRATWAELADCLVGDRLLD